MTEIELDEDILFKICNKAHLNASGYFQVKCYGGNWCVKVKKNKETRKVESIKVVPVTRRTTNSNVLEWFCSDIGIMNGLNTEIVKVFYNFTITFN